MHSEAALTLLHLKGAGSLCAQLWYNEAMLDSPAAFAALLTAANPGIRGPLTGSTMQSESRALPVVLAQP